MGKCKVCGDPTNVIFNIKFKKTHICERCARQVFIQQAEWYAQGNVSGGDVNFERYISTLKGIKNKIARSVNIDYGSLSSAIDMTKNLLDEFKNQD